MERIAIAIERAAAALEAHTVMLDTALNARPPGRAVVPFSDWACDAILNSGGYWDGDDAMKKVANAIASASVDPSAELSCIGNSLKSIQDSIASIDNIEILKRINATLETIAEKKPKKRRVE